MNMGYDDTDIVVRIKSQVYKLKHRRVEGFVDKSLLSACLINEIKSKLMNFNYDCKMN